MFPKRRLTGIIVAALILALAVTGVALATTNTQGGNNPAKNIYQNFLAKLAANLGMDQDKVIAALDATKKQMLDEAVQKGQITQQQADKIAARKNGNFGWLNGMEGRKHDFMGKRGNRMNDMAEALGITPDQLMSELKSGKKLPQIITEHGFTAEQFQQKMFEIQKAELEKAVSAGKLTQAQADKMIQKMEQHLSKQAPAAGN